MSEEERTMFVYEITIQLGGLSIDWSRIVDKVVDKRNVSCNQRVSHSLYRAVLNSYRN